MRPIPCINVNKRPRNLNQRDASAVLMAPESDGRAANEGLKAAGVEPGRRVQQSRPI